MGLGAVFIALNLFTPALLAGRSSAWPDAGDVWHAGWLVLTFGAVGAVANAIPGALDRIARVRQSGAMYAGGCAAGGIFGMAPLVFGPAGLSEATADAFRWLVVLAGGAAVGMAAARIWTHGALWAGPDTGVA